MKKTPEQIDKLMARKIQLESELKNPEIQQEDLLFKLTQSPPVQGLVGIGDALLNTGGLATETISGLMGGGYKHTPRKGGEGLSYDIGNIVGEIGPYLLPQTWPGRIALSVAEGGLTNPGESMAGAREGLAWGTAGEALSPLVKGAGTVAKKTFIEPFTLDEKTIELSRKVADMFANAEEAAWGVVSPLFKKFGGEKLIKSGAYGEPKMHQALKEFEDLFGSNRDLFSGDSKKVHDKLLSSMPTIENAQKMIKQLGIDERRIAHSLDPAKDLKLETYRDSKKLIREAVTDEMEILSPGFSDLYKQANFDFAKNVGPYYSNKTIESAAAGNVEDISKLSKAITEESKTPMKGYPGIGPEHELMDLNKQMEKLLGKSQTIPEGPAKWVPMMGTPKSREYVYGKTENAYDMINPMLRAMLQSQNVPGVNK
jgi:hypothetical protein